MKRINLILLLCFLLHSPAVWSADNTTVKVSAQSQSTPLPHYWSLGVGAGRANEGLRASWHTEGA